MRLLLQRYGKIILAIMGVVLMFVFALPTFRGMTTDDFSKMTVGHLNGKKVIQNDIRVAQAEFERLRALRLFTISVKFMNVADVVQAFSPDEQEIGTYWYLLKAEARKYASGGVSDSDLGLIMSAIHIDDVELNKFYQSANGRQFLAQDVASLDTVGDYLLFVMNQPRSAATLELLADRQLRKVKVTYAGFDAAGDWEKSPQPTDEEIKNQFDLYKGVVPTPIPGPDAESPGPLPPEIAGHHFPFGYKYPNRAAAEYLVLNRAKIREGMKETEADLDAAVRYYKSHPEEFRVAASQPAVAPPGATASQPATQTAIKPWEEVRKELLDRQIDQRVERQIRTMTEQILTRAGAPWKKGDTVERAEWVSYAEIADEIGKNPSFNGYKPEYKQTGKDVMSAEQLKDIEGIGRAAYTNEQAQVYPFPLLATSVKELVKLDTKTPLGRMGLQVGVEGPVLKDKDGNVYIYRVTQADPSHEPQSVAEVRGQVVEDLRKKTAYEQRVKEVKEALARTSDVTELARQLNPAGAAGVKTPEPFTQIDQTLPPDILMIRDFVKTAFALADQPATKPAGTQPAKPSTVLENDETLRCYAIELDNVLPATGEAFGKELGQLFQEPDPSVAAFMRSYLDIEALAKRLNYVPIEPFSKRKQ